MLSLERSISAYEARLASHFGAATRRKDLEFKHDKMRRSAFLFLRATCWRWAEAVPERWPALMRAPAASSVGDAHAGNFGLWRDAQFRLVWGVNDYDEAAVLPYTLDLVRLCASIALADPEKNPQGGADEALDAYRDALDAPSPTILEEDNGWIRDAAEAGEEDRQAFWRGLRALGTEPLEPADYRAPLAAALPAETDELRIAPRSAGVGSLGRPRFVAMGAYRGGPVVAEIKGQMPSCWLPLGQAIPAQAMATGRYRSPDPSLAYSADHVVRRLSPNNRKLDFGDMHKKLRNRLVGAMARELAAVHAGGADVGAIKSDLASRKAGWLAQAVTEVAAWTMQEFESFGGAA